MATTKLILCLLSLCASQIATVKCLNEDFNFDEASIEDLILSRNIREVAPEATNLLKAPLKLPRLPVIDFLLPKLLNTTIGKLIIEAIFDTPVFVSKVNSFLGKDILILKGNNLRISFSNVTEILKFHAGQFLEKNLKLRGLFLSIVGRYINNFVDEFSLRLKPIIRRTNITLSSKPIRLQGRDQVSSISNVRNLVLDLVIILLKPVQPRINETLFNVTNDLLNLYKPVLPNNYLESIVTCGINQTILKVIEVIDSIRNTINQLLSPPSRIKKRSSEAGTGKQTKTLIGFIAGPIRSLLSLILSPVHRFLKNLMNYVFVTLRPIVGKLVLSPLESLVMALINLIPCYKC